jgi:hypothetical protein
MSFNAGTSHSVRDSLAYHLGVFSFLLGRGSQRETREERKEKAQRRQQSERREYADGQREAEQWRSKLIALEYHLGVFAFFLGPRSQREAHRWGAKREQETKRQRYEEQRRRDAKQREAERQRQAEEERKAERQRQAEKEQKADRQQQREREWATTRDWWEELAVSVDASMDEITRAYRRKIQQYHPDRVSGLGPELVELAEHRTKALNAAYVQAKRARLSGSVRFGC